MEKRPEQKIPFFVGRTIQNAKKMKNLPVARRTGKQRFPISRKKQHNRTRKQMIWIQKKPTKGAPNFRTHDSKKSNKDSKIKQRHLHTRPFQLPHQNADHVCSILESSCAAWALWFAACVWSAPEFVFSNCVCSNLGIPGRVSLRLLSLSSCRILCWYCTSCPVYWLPLAVLHRGLPLCGFVWDCGSLIEFCPVRLPTRLFSHVCHASCCFIFSCLGIPNDPQWHTPSENPVRHCEKGKKWGRTIGHTRNQNMENNLSEKCTYTLSTTVVYTQKWSARRKGHEYGHVMVHAYSRKCKIDFTILTYWLQSFFQTCKDGTHVKKTTSPVEPNRSKHCMSFFLPYLIWSKIQPQNKSNGEFFLQLPDKISNCRDLEIFTKKAYNLVITQSFLFVF